MTARFCISSIISNCDHFNLFYAVDSWITLGPGQSLKIDFNSKSSFGNVYLMEALSFWKSQFDLKNVYLCISKSLVTVLLLIRNSFYLQVNLISGLLHSGVVEG